VRDCLWWHPVKKIRMESTYKTLWKLYSAVCHLMTGTHSEKWIIRCTMQSKCTYTKEDNATKQCNLMRPLSYMWSSDGNVIISPSVRFYLWFGYLFYYLCLFIICFKFNV
jgi:hypothetical protein